MINPITEPPEVTVQLLEWWTTQHLSGRQYVQV